MIGELRYCVTSQSCSSQFKHHDCVTMAIVYTVKGQKIKNTGIILCFVIMGVHGFGMY